MKKHIPALSNNQSGERRGSNTKHLKIELAACVGTDRAHSNRALFPVGALFRVGAMLRIGPFPGRGYSDRGLAARDEYLLKPLHPHQLLAKIRQYLPEAGVVGLRCSRISPDSSELLADC
jgi:hypothetical protein